MLLNGMRDLEDWRFNMKIAVCISGQWRFYDKAVRNIIENLIIPHDCDVFCYFSNDTHIDFKEKVAPEEIIGTVVDYFGNHVKNIGIETSDHIVKKENPTGSPAVWCENMASMIETYGNVHPRTKKIELCNNLKKKYEEENGFKYDAVISIRSDFYFERPFSIDEVKDKTVYCIGREISGIPRVWDGFWYANSETFDTACSDIINWFPSMNGIREDAEELFEKLRVSHFILSPENSLLYNWIIKDGFDLEVFDLPATILRSSGKFHTYEAWKPLANNIATSLPKGFVLDKKYCKEGLTHLCS